MQVKKPNYKLYDKNIQKLLDMEKKERYDNDKSIVIGFYDGKEILTTEFLVAKQFGLLEKFQGHGELKYYFKLIPYIFSKNLFNEVFQNLDNERFIYSLKIQKHRIFHILDENNKLVSVFIVKEKNFLRQLDKKFRLTKSTWEDSHPSILSPAGLFWRQVDLIEQLYQKLSKNTKEENNG